MIDFRDCYSADYFEARERFLKHAKELDLPSETFLHPQSSEFDQDVAVDVVRIGSIEAKYVLFVTSGVHGTELTAGSGPQLQMLSHFNESLPADTALVLVHAMNAYGSAKLTRTDENNVDPNRNIRADFSKLPVNESYRELHSALCPKEWQGEGREKADVGITHYVEEKGVLALTQDVLQGQYEYPDGIFYGGKTESWCVSNFTQIVKDHAKGADQIAIVDIHTGVGPYGFGEVMRVDRPAPADVEWENIGGFVCDILDRADCPKAPIKILLEFGTYEFDRVLTGLRGDNWLRHHGDPQSSWGRQIKRNLRDALFANDEKWLGDISRQSLEVCEATLQELKGASETI